MSNQFEVGDRITCIDPPFHSVLTLNKIYTVVEIQSFPLVLFVGLYIDDDITWWAGDRFTLLSEHKPVTLPEELFEL